MFGRRLRSAIAAGASLLTVFATPTAGVALPFAPLDGAGLAPTPVRGGGHVHAGRPGGWHGAARPLPAHPPRPQYHGGYYRPPANVYVNRRPAYYGGWRRPAYGWAPGGAIAAGAALGFLTAAAAASYAASAAPAPGLCWYYTDAFYSSGFWDACP